jgi:hypothetical protein
MDYLDGILGYDIPPGVFEQVSNVLDLLRGEELVFNNLGWPVVLLTSIGRAGLRCKRFEL